jgi:hypothetical protein
MVEFLRRPERKKVCVAHCSVGSDASVSGFVLVVQDVHFRSQRLNLPGRSTDQISRRWGFYSVDRQRHPWWICYL